MPATALPKFLLKKQNRRDGVNTRPSIRDLQISEPIPHPLADVPTFTRPPRKTSHVYTSPQTSNKYSALSTTVTTSEPDKNPSSESGGLPHRARYSQELRNKCLPRTPVDGSRRKPLPDWDAESTDDPLSLAKVFSRESHSTVRQGILYSVRQRHESTSSGSSGSFYPTASRENLIAHAPSASAYSLEQATVCSYLHVGENIEPVEHFAVLRWSQAGPNRSREALFVEVYTNDGRMLIPVVYPPEFETPLQADQVHSAHPEDVYQVIRRPGTDGPPFDPPNKTSLSGETLDLYEQENSLVSDGNASTTLPPPSLVIGIVPRSLQQPSSPSSVKDGNWLVTQRNKLAVSPKGNTIWMTGSVVGAGAFGRVVRVLHVLSETEVAMKVVHVQKPLLKIACEGLMNELKVLTKLAVMSGKELVPFLATPSIECDKFAWTSAKTGFLHILTPFCPGGDLYGYKKNLSFDSVRIVVAELVLGLSYLHSLGIVHHDFKPENVLVDAQGHCIITDFGGSRFLNEQGQLTRIAHEDIICSSPYAAPELVFDDNPGSIMVYDEKVDWFSLGAVIYTLLAGFELFSRKGYMVMEQRQLIEEQFHRKFPYRVEDQPDLYDFMLQLLRFHPKRRLAGESINNHAYLSPFKNHWNDIINRQYTPPIRQVRDVGGKARGYSKPPKDDWMVATPNKSGSYFSQVLADEGWYLPQSEEYDFPAELKSLARS